MKSTNYEYPGFKENEGIRDADVTVTAMCLLFCLNGSLRGAPDYSTYVPPFSWVVAVPVGYSIFQPSRCRFEVLNAAALDGSGSSTPQRFTELDPGSAHTRQLSEANIPSAQKIIYYRTVIAESISCQSSVFRPHARTQEILTDGLA